MMNVQCANPECCAELKYLRGGRLYLMERERGPGLEGAQRLGIAVAPVAPVDPHLRRYFWLCQSCAQMFTLRRWTDQGIELVARRRPPVAVMPPRLHGQNDHDWMLPGLVG